jgi:hypothetical protein
LISSIFRPVLLAICLVAEPAHATNWYILNAATGECEVAAQQARKQRLPALASPEAAEIDARHHGLFRDKKIFRYDDGEVGLVLITNTDKMTLAYAVDLESCQIAARSWVDNGIIGKPGELR